MKNRLSDLFTYPLKLLIDNPSINTEFLQEIRLRTGKPLLITYKGEEFFYLQNGSLSKVNTNAVMADNDMINNMLQVFSSYSLYAFEDEIKQGFLTISGGHRVGICGKVVLADDAPKTIKHISSINIRMAHEIKGCAKPWLKYLYDNNSIFNTLIVSPPGAGKTTLLRDIIRCISDGESLHEGLTVGIVDERSEIAACYKGIPQNDVGIRTDVLDCCPKREGMMMLLRSMAPKVIAIDEIGDSKDYEAIDMAMYCGCKIIGTVHGNSYEELLQKKYISDYLKNGIVRRLIFLRDRKVLSVMDEKGREVRFVNND